MAQTTLFWHEQHFAPIYWKITIGKQQVFNFALIWCLFLINIYLPDKLTNFQKWLYSYINLPQQLESCLEQQIFKIADIYNSRYSKYQIFKAQKKASDYKCNQMLLRI